MKANQPEVKEDEDVEFELIQQGNALDEIINIGVYRLVGPITESSCNLISQMIYAESIRLKNESVLLIIDSSGGDVHAAFSLVAHIRSSLIPVHCVAMGTCASAALFIAMACEKRIIDRNCAVLSHQYSAEFGGLSKHIDLMARVKDFEMTAKRIEDHYVKETGKDIKYVRKHLLGNADVFMSAEEAIKHGMFDGLLEDNIDIFYNGVLEEVKPLLEQSVDSPVTSC